MESFTALLNAPDDNLSQPREPPHLSRFRIPPLRDAVPSRILKIPSPLEPSAGSLRESSVSKVHPSNGNPPTKLPTLADFLNAARSDKIDQHISGTRASLEPPPKPILPFINLRTVENLPNPFDEEVPRKRARLELQTEGFGEHLHLPVPKIHKEASKPRTFGPLTILNGLNEPPPNAALFPPIETDSTPTILTRPSRDTNAQAPPQDEPRRHKIAELIDPTDSPPEDDVQPKHIEPKKSAERNPLERTNGNIATKKRQQSSEDKQQRAESPPPSNKSSSRKKLRRWTEQETRDLLRGVVRCGVGNWTAILSQSDLNFNERTAANLKDRFRVCCPWAYEYEESMGEEALRSSLADTALKSISDFDGKILLPDPRKIKPNSDQSATNGLSNRDSVRANSAADEISKANSGKKGASTSKGSEELSRKSQLTLVSLGLQDPQNTIKSKPRLRRPFTAAEDEALLKGYRKHGFQWTLIQQDKELDLLHRRATVLRDRFRTRFPDTYKDGGAATIVVEDDGKTVPLGSETLVAERLSQPTHTSKPGSNAASSAVRSCSSGLHNAGQHKRSQRSPTTPLEGAVPVDPAMSPPAPPSNLPDFSKSSSSFFPFSIDDGGSGSDVRWPDNTLPPPVWDDMG
jgi:hypothetical protein